MTANGNGNGNGRNGLFLKVIIGLCVALSAGATGGGIKLYGDVRELQKATDLERRVAVMEDLANSINADRHKRTEIIQQIRDEIARLDRRIERVEARK